MIQGLLLSSAIRRVLGAALVAALVYGGYSYVTNRLQELEELKTKNQQIMLELTGQQEINARLKDNAEKLKVSNANLASSLERSEDYQDYLVSLYQKHDLTRLAMAKPGLIELRINSKTKEVFDEMATDSAR